MARQTLNIWETDMHLTEDEALLVETVTKLVSDEVKPFARGWETTGIPKELWTTLGELGLLAITTPESKGGAGFGLRDLGLVVGYLAQGDLALGVGAREAQPGIGNFGRDAIPNARALPYRAATNRLVPNIDHQRLSRLR